MASSTTHLMAVYVALFTLTYGILAVDSVPSTASVPTVAPVTFTTVKVPTVAPVTLPKKFKPSTVAVPGEAPTTTTTTTTTTEAPTTVVPEVAKDDAKIRLCACSEVETCNKEAYEKMKECKASCQFNLEYFGTATDKYLACFPDHPEEAHTITTCLKDNVEGFCNADAETPVFVPKQDYSAFYEPYALKEDTAEHVVEKQKVARVAFGHFRKFQSCVVTCFKKAAVACYEKTGCDVALPEKDDFQVIYKECHMLKPQISLPSFKACTCLAHKQGVDKLIGACGFLGIVMKL